MRFTNLTGKNADTKFNNRRSKPSASIYDLSICLNTGISLGMRELRGKNLLIVNTASDCGYTPQYAELEELYQTFKNDLLIIAFPANDFKEQEKGSDEDIAAFCRKNFGVSFPIASKSSVKKGEDQNEVFRWLTHKELNGWNDKEPAWNFNKYLVNRDGILTHCFGSSISPLDSSIVKEVKQDQPQL
jgi:glutathione peroxidase